MINILIKYMIRDKYPDFGNIPLDCIELDLYAALDTKETDIANLYKPVKQFVNDNALSGKKCMLYLLAPNSVSVAVSFLLSKLKVDFEFLPKSTDSDEWGYRGDEININKTVNFIKKYKIDDLSNKKICIKLIGKFNISGKRDIIFESNKKTYFVTKEIKSNSNNILHVAYVLRLPEIYNSLTNKNTCKKFKENIDEILDNLLENSITKVHILSSIPIYGLIYLGKKISEEPFRDIEFIIYNPIINDNIYEYQAGTILSVERFQQL